MSAEPATSSRIAEATVLHHEVVHSLEHDPNFFIDFFIHDELLVPIPKFHENIFERMTHTETSRFALAVPRGHAKTTIAKLTCVWYWLFSDFSFIIYVSNTRDIAAACVRDVIGFMLSDNFKQVFGDVQFHIQRESEGYYEFTLGQKRCIIKARGATQQLRGTNVGNRRPQLAICDDLEDEDNTNTVELIQKMKTWFFGAFLKALDQFKNKLIYIGTVRGRNTLLLSILGDESYHSIRLGAILSNGKPLWPDLWSLEKLREDFAYYARHGMIHVWFAEMMNISMAGGKTMVDVSKIKYLPSAVPGSIEYGFITIDPAFSRQTWANASSICVHGWLKTDYCWQLIEDVTEVGLTPQMLFDTVIRLCYKWGITVVGIEAVAAQKVLKPVFEMYCEFHGIEGMHFVDLAASQRKAQRIAAWTIMLTNGSYCLRLDDMKTTDQLIHFNPLKQDNEDDLVDSAAYSVQMIDLYMPLIMQQTPVLQAKNDGLGWSVEEALLGAWA